MSKPNWINCSRLREYEDHHITEIRCDYCDKVFFKDQVWKSFHPVKRKWCTQCKDNSENKTAKKNQQKQLKEQMKNNQLSLFEEGEIS